MKFMGVLTFDLDVVERESVEFSSVCMFQERDFEIVMSKS